jgi:competence protein ComGC
MLRGRTSGFSLVEILVVVLIIMVLAAFLLPNYLGGKTPEGKTIKSPINRAKGVECGSYLQQVRMAYQMATASDEIRPQSVADLRPYGVSDSISKCPVGGEPYQLDPNTGTVRCLHPGHEKN